MPSAVSTRAQTISLRRPIFSTCASTLRILSVVGSAAASKGETGSAGSAANLKKSLRENRFHIDLIPRFERIRLTSKYTPSHRRAEDAPFLRQMSPESGMPGLIAGARAGLV